MGLQFADPDGVEVGSCRTCDVLRRGTFADIVAEVVQCGIPAFRVVPALNELEECHVAFGLSARRATVDEFGFERGKEVLSRGITPLYVKTMCQSTS